MTSWESIDKAKVDDANSNAMTNTSEKILTDIFEMQKKLMNVIDGDNKKKEVDEREHGINVSNLCTAVIHEAVELQDLTSWKWWKKSKPSKLNEQEAREEATDIFHFCIQLFLALGMEPKDVYYEYARKHNINMQRQKDGY